MSWPQIFTIIGCTAVPFFIWGLKVGRARTWNEVNAHARLMQSAVDKAWSDNHAEFDEVA